MFKQNIIDSYHELAPWFAVSAVYLLIGFDIALMVLAK